MKYLFVGEKPSKTAYERGWTWKSGRLAAKQLFDALQNMGINPHEQAYTNLWDYEDNELILNIPHNTIVVGMGNIVQHELHKRNISHIGIIHPAARGKIRAKDKYAKHVKLVLCGGE